MNVRIALIGFFVALTIVLASIAVYKADTNTTITSMSILNSTATTVSTTTNTTTQTTTETSLFDPNKAIADAYLSHLGGIDSRNASTLAAQYETNATLQYSLWNGTAELTGGVNGVTNITRFLVEEPAKMTPCETCFGLKAPFAFANETHSVLVSSDDKTGNVTAHLLFWGVQSPGACYVPFVGSCVAQYDPMVFDISYVLQGGSWLISTESLTYGGSGACTSASSSPDGGTFYCFFNSAGAPTNLSTEILPARCLES